MYRPLNELPESRIYSFLDNTHSHTIHFLEGQKLIHDLVLTHDLKKEAFSYFRDSVLGLELLTALLKPGETLGLFVDSDTPYFRLKVETNYAGRTRALVYPDNFQSKIEKIDGQVRLSKIVGASSNPYNSILKLEKSSTKDIVNLILKQSYQVESSINISKQSDQSVMLFKLPLLSEKIAQKENLKQINISPNEYWLKKQILISDLFKTGTTDGEEIVKTFTDEGLTFLGVKEIKFQCSCSKDRMLAGIKSLVHTTSLDDIFEKEKEELESKCDYCKTNYIITRDEVTSFN